MPSMPAMVLSSPESSPHRNGYDSSPPTSPEQLTCTALVVDTLAPCTRTRPGSTSYCGPHGREYGELTHAYKELSDEVKRLKDTGWLSPDRRMELRSLEGVELAINCAEQWRDKIPKEIEARRTHHDRFFPMQCMLPLSSYNCMRSLVFVLCVALYR